MLAISPANGRGTPMIKQSGLHFVQRVQPPAALAQAHSLVPLAPFFKVPVYKAPKVVQVPFYKMTVVVLTATHQWILRSCLNTHTGKVLKVPRVHKEADFRSCVLFLET